ncbi:MAG: 50S ribosomal protein L22 [Phycisphaeraceae bacterium]|nr:50S ribosomal protein L22 [Phycisphaeraceae bacterium]MCW5754329.1 50S ribosomal protein L22 [Phycisphaeraceae bacterium]
MQRAVQANVGVDALAAAVERTGLPPETAARAVNNWLNGRDHPRCKHQDIAKLAQAVGAAPKDIARFESRVLFTRGSTRKVRLVADMIRGQNARKADIALSYSPKRAAVNIRKALLAAMTDARAADADLNALVVTVSCVDEGPQIKRFRPKDRGRAHAIIKQTSHITIAVEEKA